MFTSARIHVQTCMTPPMSANVCEHTELCMHTHTLSEVGPRGQVLSTNPPCVELMSVASFHGTGVAKGIVQPPFTVLLYANM